MEHILRPSELVMLILHSPQELDDDLQKFGKRNYRKLVMLLTNMQMGSTIKTYDLYMSIKTC